MVNIFFNYKVKTPIPCQNAKKVVCLLDNLMEKITYPIRINRYLALHNYCSRREADVLIGKKIVFINGQPAKIGDKVNENDLVEVDLESRKAVKEYVYFAYNKPKGLMTNNDQAGILAQLDNLKMASDQVSATTAKVGNTMNRLDLAKGNLQALSQQLTDLSSKTADVDIAALSTKLAMQQLALQASYTVAAKMGDNTILNFIK